MDLIYDLDKERLSKIIPNIIKNESSRFKS